MRPFLLKVGGKPLPVIHQFAFEFREKRMQKS